MFPQQPLYPMSWYTAPNVYYPNYRYQSYGHPLMYPTMHRHAHNQYHMDPRRAYYPHRFHQPQGQPPLHDPSSNAQTPQNTSMPSPASSPAPSASSTSPTLRRIEIRTETSNGEEINIPLTSSTYEHMNQFISNLVQDVNVHNQLTMTDGSHMDSEGELEHGPENDPENDPQHDPQPSAQRVSITDLQNHTQLETFDAESAPTPEHCTCSICHNTMSGHIVRVLRCSHTFHNDCVDRWLGSASTCPLCRTSVVPDERENMV